VWRGIGSIAALHVTVKSKYNHQAAPVPNKGQEMHHHEHASHSHSHEHEHHSHSHEHANTNVDNTPKSEERKDNNNPSSIAKEHNHSHSHGHGHDHSHSHAHHSSDSEHRGPLRNLPQIRQMLQDAPSKHIPEWVCDNAIEAFTELAKAEAMTHGAESTDAVHFHEVGAIDSIVDTVGTLLALYALGVATVSSSRLPLGEGTVWTDHGLLPVPAPATLRLMVGMPTCPGPKGTTGELVTPTAAALLRVLVKNRSKTVPNNNKGVPCRPPEMILRKIGIGAGTKDFVKHPNVLRLMLGDAER
jgi:uncharacterized protein (DUF111 family)